MLFTIDIGGTFIKYGLIDADYQLVHTDKIPTPPHPRLKSFGKD